MELLTKEEKCSKPITVHFLPMVVEFLLQTTVYCVCDKSIILYKKWGVGQQVTKFFNTLQGIFINDNSLNFISFLDFQILQLLHTYVSAISILSAMTLHILCTEPNNYRTPNAHDRITTNPLFCLRHTATHLTSPVVLHQYHLSQS